MRKYLGLSAVFALAAHAGSFTLTLRQAVDRALTQNPEVVMARTDEMKAQQAVRLAREPFSTRVTGGSGLAYTYGIPLSVEGNAPSIFQVRASQFLFNKSQSYAIAQAKENTRAAGFAAGERRDEAVFRVAALFIDADRAGRQLESVRRQAESLEKVLETVDARVEAGRELPLAHAEANVSLLRAKQRLMSLEGERDIAARNLAVALGYEPGDVVLPAPAERPPAVIPESEDAALRAAMAANKELRRLESNYQAKALEIKSDKAQRLPRVDLVAQYALFAKYSNYDQYFRTFQYNNAELGASIQIPLLLGPGVTAQVQQAEAEQLHIRAELQAARGRIALDVHQSYLDVGKSEMARQVTKAELDLAHEQLSVLLAQMNEGKAALKQVEEARFNEDEKWMAFYDAQFSAEKARLGVLKQTGELTAALQ